MPDADLSPTVHEDECAARASRAGTPSCKKRTAIIVFMEDTMRWQYYSPTRHVWVDGSKAGCLAYRVRHGALIRCVYTGR